MDPGCGGGAAVGDTDGGNVDCAEAGTAGNGAVRRLGRRTAAGDRLPAIPAEPRPWLHGMPARRVTRSSYTGHSHSRLDHASALANRNAMTAT